MILEYEGLFQLSNKTFHFRKERPKEVSEEIIVSVVAIDAY